MADNDGTVMVTEAKVEEPLTDAAKPEEKPVMGVSLDDFAKQQAELEKTRKALKDANKEAADRRKRLDELEKLETDRKTAEMTEVEKAQARIKELEGAKAELEARQREAEHRELQRKVAKAVNLPLGLAERLRGKDEEELIVDAKQVLEFLPKQDVSVNKLTPKLEPTNPADGTKGETDAQKRARLLGRRFNVWDADMAKQHGGGVTFVERE